MPIWDAMRALIHFLEEQDPEIARAKRPIRSGYKRASATRGNLRDLGLISLACTSGSEWRLHERDSRRSNIPQRL